jgi:hypothetical protein
MHCIDRLELLETLAELRREVRVLMREPAAGDRLMRLRRIIFLLGYMAEHLEMLSGPAVSRREYSSVGIAEASEI